MTVDTENGIVLGVDCYPANRRESDIILKHIEGIAYETGLNELLAYKTYRQAQLCPTYHIHMLLFPLSLIMKYYLEPPYGCRAAKWPLTILELSSAMKSFLPEGIAVESLI